MKISLLLDFSWNTLLSIVLFLVALGVLVTIHELGHFIAAKSFKVYCTDFSIGFGPKIVKIKRKKGETTFSIGIVPLGGYVQMYGEGAELPEGVSIPASRSLEGIKRWKRIIIMFAGIFMNFILAYLIFLIAVGCFEQSQLYINFEKNENFGKTESSLKVVDSEGTEVALENMDYFGLNSFYYTIDGVEHSISNVVMSGKKDEGSDYYGTASNFSYVDPNSGLTSNYVLVLNTNTSSFGANNRDFASFLVLYQAKPYEAKVINEKGEKVDYGTIYLPTYTNNKIVSYPYVNGSKIETPIDVLIRRNDKETETVKDLKGELSLVSGEKSFKSFGLSFFVERYWNGANSFNVAGKLWVKSCSLISDALGKLFIGQGWNNVGGPVAILSQTTDTLMSSPFYVYLQQWGLISVNLALFNLLPFPGLDGWQILVEIIEGSVNGIKKSRYKFKNKKAFTSSNGKPYNVEIDIKDDNDANNKEAKTSVILNEKDNKGASSNATKVTLVGDEVTALQDKEVVIGEVVDEKQSYQEWKIPTKVKTVMSYLGLGLLFAFMAVVFIMDIVRLF